MERSPLISAEDPLWLRRGPIGSDGWSVEVPMRKKPCRDLERNILERLVMHSAPVIVDETAQTVWVYKAADSGFDGGSAETLGDWNVIVDFASMIAYAPGREWLRDFERKARLYRREALVIPLDEIKHPKRIHFAREIIERKGHERITNELMSWRARLFQAYLPLAPHSNPSAK